MDSNNEQLHGEVFKAMERPALRSFLRGDIKEFLDSIDIYKEALKAAEISKERINVNTNLKYLLNPSQLQLVSKRLKQKLVDVQEKDIKAFLLKEVQAEAYVFVDPVKVLSFLRIKYQPQAANAVAELEMFLEDQVRKKNINPLSFSLDTVAGRIAYFKVLKHTLPLRLLEKFNEYIRITKNIVGDKTLEKDPDYALCIDRFTQLVELWFQSIEMTMAKKIKFGQRLDPSMYLNDETQLLTKKGYNRSYQHSSRRARFSNNYKAQKEVAVKAVTIKKRKKEDFRCFNCNSKDHSVWKCPSISSKEKKKEIFEREMRKFKKRRVTKS